jgi:hypothetical protein
LSSELKRMHVMKGMWGLHKQARLRWEYVCDFTGGDGCLPNLKVQGIDIVSFIERTFLKSANRSALVNASYLSKRSLETEMETIGLLRTSPHESWFRSLGKTTRGDIRRSERRGILVKDVQVDDRFLRDAQLIYNETPVRQGRRYTRYGVSIEDLRKDFLDFESQEFLGAYDDTQLIGLFWMMPGDRVAQIRALIHLISKRNKLPTSALIDAAVRKCSERGIQFLVYPTTYGLQPGLDSFRLRMKFFPFAVPRHYVPLTRRGSIAIRLHVHKPIQYVIPRNIAGAISPIYNHISSALPSIADHMGGIEFQAP